jgi:hypothetical protein
MTTEHPQPPVPPEELVQLQRSFQEWVTLRTLHAAETSGQQAKVLSEQESVSPEVALTRSHQLAATERLGVYRNAYVARLLDCLREEFPALHYCLGDELFSFFAASYVQAEPPQSYSLGDLGGGLADFLRRTCPAVDSQGEPGWSTFIIELAAWERTVSEVYDGPGPEDEPPFSLESLDFERPETAATLQLVVAPSLRSVECAFGVHRYAAAVRQGLSPQVPLPQQTFLVVLRHAYRVRHYELDPQAWRLLQSLAAGVPLATAIATVAIHGSGEPGVHHDPDRLAQRLYDWFRHWGALGFFSRAPGNDRRST